jgi:3-hydroxyacyl-[acyl-carrier-protein] dehydratase
VSISSQALCPVGWLEVRPDHPALAGHFPGQPLVPGVVLLDWVLDLIRESLAPNAVIVNIPWVKFLLPVLPGKQLMIGLDLVSAERLRFVCRTDDQLNAQGLLVLAFAAKP